MNEIKTRTNGVPLLTVVCTTYNHEPYIRKCLEGIFMQKTDFLFEVILHDDASTDKTVQICSEFEIKYPEIIKPIYQKENQYSQGNFINLYGMAKGKYIALCEGDDYWTDPDKLQKQVDFLEANLDYSLCFHNSLVIYTNKIKSSHLFASYLKDKYTIEDVIEREWFVPTQSMVFRREMYNLPIWNSYIYNGDYAIQLLLAKNGPFHYINQVMSVYRKHKSSLSATKAHHYPPLKKMQLLNYFDLNTEFVFNNLISNQIQKISDVLYLAYLHDRPLLIRLVSIDYYILKIISILKKIKKID